MNLAVQRFRVDSEFDSVAADVGQRDLRRFLHHVTQLTGQLQARLTVDCPGLDVEHIAAQARHRQSGRHPRHRGTFGGFRREARTAKVANQIRLVDHDRFRVGIEFGGDLAQRLGQQPLVLPHTGFAGVVGGDLAQRRVGDRDLLGGQCRAVALPGQQVVAGDGHLVVLGVAVDLHQFHAVQQGRRDVLDHVGGRQEHHVGQVQILVQVVVAERVVLRRIQHLQQGRRRVAAIVRADLVDLVEQHHRVHRTGLADRPDDAAGQRPDVGAPVPTDLRLVAHAAQGDANELAAQRPSDALTQ